MTRLFTSENEKDLMALLEMLQGFLTMLGRDLAVSLFAMVHRFTEMNDALTNMFIATLLFHRIIVALTHLPLTTHTFFHSAYFLGFLHFPRTPDEFP